MITLINGPWDSHEIIDSGKVEIKMASLKSGRRIVQQLAQKAAMQFTNQTKKELMRFG